MNSSNLFKKYEITHIGNSDKLVPSYLLKWVLIVSTL